MFFKISMNECYGYNGLNSKHYNWIKIVNSKKHINQIISVTYMNCEPLSEDSNLIQSQLKSFRCKICIQESFFTFVNAKFWYLTFINDILFKCFDLNQFYFTSCDTDNVDVVLSNIHDVS